MSGLRVALVALLVVSTALFAVGAMVEHSQADAHTEPPSTQAQEESDESAGEPEGAPQEGDERADSAHTEEREKLLGVDTESTPLLVVAVLAGLALAGIAGSPLGRAPAVLLLLGLFALAWAALDVREASQQVDESHAGIAATAIVVAVLHFAAAAIAGGLALRSRRADVGTPGHPGTLAA
jgi:Flp pilus assembly protein TadB